MGLDLLEKCERGKFGTFVSSTTVQVWQCSAVTASVSVFNGPDLADIIMVHF